MKLKRFSFVILISLSLVLAQESKQKILLSDVSNPKTEIKVLSESEGEIIIQFNVDDFYSERLETENGIFSKLTFEDGMSTTELGKPQLPVFRKIVELPYDANPMVEIISSTVEKLNIAEKGMTKIYPLQYPVSKTPEYKPFEFDDDIYKTDKYYPDNIFEITDLGLLRKHNLYQITVFPIQYNPVQAKLKVYTNVTFKLYFNTDKSSSTQLEIRRYQSELFDQIVNSVSFNNKSQKSAVLMKTATELPSTFLIICHDNFYNTISSFASHKENLGFDVTVVKKSDLADQTANGIRNYIINAYNNWDPPVENVLLVGDVAYIPTFTGDYCNTASDLKYSLMDGDWLPDVFVGRFSVETTTQLSNIVNKQIDYETQDWSTLDWIKKAVFMASNDNYTISEGTHNNVISNYLDPEGYTSDKLYCHTYNATTTQVINAFNNGRIFGVYSGHGSETSWADGPPLSQSQVRNLTNSYKLPLIFSFACLTGKFDYGSECFGETWLRESNKAAVGFWGSSRPTQWYPDDRLEKCLFSSIYDDIKTSFGEMTVEAKIKFLNYYPISEYTAKDYFEKYNILGDPSLNYAHGVSGTISQNTTWGGTIIVIGNVTVSSGVTLNIRSGASVNLNGYNITSAGGTIIVEAGATLNPDIRLYDGTAIKGLYPSLASALTDASSGNRIYANNLTISFSQNYSIPSGITFEFNNSNLSFGSNIQLRVVGGLKCNNTTFTRSGSSNWWGIRFYYSAIDGNCIIENSTISYANYGLYAYYSNPTIRNNTISNCTYGIYLYNSNNAIVDKNTITACTRGIYGYYAGLSDMTDNLITSGGSTRVAGIQVYATDEPSVYNNTIEGSFTYGMDADYYSRPLAIGPGGQNYQGYNWITGGGTATIKSFRALSEKNWKIFLEF